MLLKTTTPRLDRVDNFNVAVVIVINVVIVGFSWKDFKWLGPYNCPISDVRLQPSVRLHYPITILQIN